MNLAENDFSNEYFNFNLGAYMVILIIHSYHCQYLAEMAGPEFCNLPQYKTIYYIFY